MSEQKNPIVIVGAARTPMGGFQGDLKDTKAPQLGAVAIKSALQRAGLKPGDADEVIMGVVLPAGQGQAPARQSSRGAGIPDDVGCTTVNKMCGSGMKAAMLAHDGILAGSASIAVAGGMESMSNAPYLLSRARQGYRMGHGEVFDHMFLDGLEDAYDKGKLMGCYAEDTATAYQFTRDAQDDFAIESLNRARKAIEDGTFDAEVAPVTVNTRKGKTTVERDEQPLKADIEKIRKLKPEVVELKFLERAEIPQVVGVADDNDEHLHSQQWIHGAEPDRESEELGYPHGNGSTTLTGDDGEELARLRLDWEEANIGGLLALANE